jgi:PAS domain S-box-containing protein
MVGLAYYVGCLAGFALRFPGSGISFFWPPTAALTAALLLAPPSAWPRFLAGAFVAHAFAHARDGVPATAWLIQFVGNGCQAVLAALVVERWSRTRPLFSDIRSVLTFVAGACIAAPAIASLIPAAVYVHLNWSPDFWDAWLARAVTNAVASMTLVPSFVVAGQFLLATPTRVPRRLVEFGLLLLGIGAVHMATGYLPRADVLGLSVALYAPTPFLLWAIARFGASGMSLALLWTTVLTIVTASSGNSPFGADLSGATVLGVQVFVGANAVLMMLIAGVLEAHRTEHARLVDVFHENSVILSRLRATQQRYELATAAGGLGVWEFDVQNGGVHIEGNLKALLGYGDGDIEDTVEGWLRLVASADRADVQSRLTAFTTGATSSLDAEFQIVHRDGSLRWIAWKGAVVDGVGGAPTCLTGTYADVTERKQSERALRDATDALARKWRISAMSELSAALAHELNQPLTAIATNVTVCLRWIEGDAPADNLEGALRDVLHDSRRATHIVERMRAMFANAPIEAAPLNFNDVVRDIVEIARPRLRELQITLDVRLADSLPSVLADAVQMRQVLLNLIVNATEAMREPSDRCRLIRIRTRHIRNVAIVSVSDTGEGFQPDDRRRLFEPFYTTKTGGTGMGLAISRSIMESHGGSLHALGNVGDGATFRIKLPVAEQLIDTAETFEKRRVLVVDDHEGMGTSPAPDAHS